jgi:hypothetical protein
MRALVSLVTILCSDGDGPTDIRCRARSSVGPQHMLCTGPPTPLLQDLNYELWRPFGAELWTMESPVGWTMKYELWTTVTTSVYESMNNAMARMKFPIFFLTIFWLYGLGINTWFSQSKPIRSMSILIHTINKRVAQFFFLNFGVKVQ